MEQETSDLVKDHNNWPRGSVVAIICICTLGLSLQLQAQQAGQAPPGAASPVPPKSANDPGAAPNQSNPAPQPSAPQAKATNEPGVNTNPSEPATQSPKNDRLFYALPNYLTVEKKSSLPPLTTKQKFKLVAEGTYDPIELVFIAAESGVYQANNTDPTLGLGIRGYAKRNGLTIADDSVENFMVGAVLASAFRQDPRYYQLGSGSFLHRVGYAALRVVITRSDAGKNQFNVSEILGSATAAGISNTYHPGPWTMGTTLPIWGEQVGWDAVGFEMKEFWPDIHRYIQRHMHKS
jgi:hypothetical protein